MLTKFLPGFLSSGEYWPEGEVYRKGIQFLPNTTPLDPTAESGFATVLIYTRHNTFLLSGKDLHYCVLEATKN